ncbi:MAG: hypothetical protein ACK456_12605, partial [Pseudanabaenaceae cyanobacterium]
MSSLNPLPQSAEQLEPLIEPLTSSPVNAAPNGNLPAPNPDPRDMRKWFATLGIGIGVFIFALDVYIVNLALPVMVTVLDTNFA